MDMEERLKVEEGHFVNEATLKLLRMEIEGYVKRRFFAWIGAPIGLLGIISIFYVLFSYIPDHLGKIMDNDPRIRNAIRTSVTEYLKDEDTGKQFIRQQVDSAAEKHIKASVIAHITSNSFQQILHSSINEQTISYYEGERGANQINKIVDAQMQSTAVRNQIKAAVVTALAPAIVQLDAELKANRYKLVLDLPDLGNWAQVRKADMNQLRRFLNDEANQLLKLQAPVVLSVPIGNPNYYRPVFDSYHTILRDKLGRQFRYVHIADNRGKFLGLVPVGKFMQALSEGEGTEDDLLRYLRGDDSRLMSDYLKRKFGHNVQKRIGIEKKVREVLMDAQLWESVCPDEYLPVIRNGQLDGLTNRGKLIDGLLG